jgi:hypothetical protein
MIGHSFGTPSIVIAALLIGCLAGLPAVLDGHCDTLGGPVVKEGRTALETGTLTPVLKWVKADREAELRAAFARARAVRSKGAEAKELADLYFLETLVRLHRAGEGAPYTGLKDEPVEPIVAMTDEALAAGSDKDLVRAVGAHLAAAIGEKFGRVLGAMKEKDTSIQAGREFVEAYVAYTHFVEAVHTAIAGGAGDGHGGAATSPHKR